MTFKNLFLLPAMLFITTNFYSQVGIGTTEPSQAAMLEVSSQSNGTGTYRGLMPPRVPDVEARDQIPVTAEDEGLMVYVKNTGCFQIWDGTSWKEGLCSNYSPVAINVDFEGELFVGQNLEAKFIYYDADADPEGAHLYQWYRANNASGYLATAISGATTPSYELVSEDTNKYIAVKITPVANVGRSPGIPSMSIYKGAVLAQTTWALDLFISEYVEGSSNNKAIEIANFTGVAKNLNDYELVKYINGSAENQSIISFSPGAVLNHGEVWVVKHASATAITANQTSNLLDFNGDDPVALKTSGNVIIDIVGKIGVQNNFGVDKTLRKKPAIGPSQTYNASDYIVFQINTFDGLGNHTY